MKYLGDISGVGFYVDETSYFLRFGESDPVAIPIAAHRAMKCLVDDPKDSVENAEFLRDAIQVAAGCASKESVERTVKMIV